MSGSTYKEWTKKTIQKDHLNNVEECDNQNPWNTTEYFGLSWLIYNYELSHKAKEQILVSSSISQTI